MKQYTRITGLSESRRIPRIDKIRLGAKVEKKSSGKTVEYPVELPFFLLPDSVAKIHGGKIEEIEARAKALHVTRADTLKFLKENAHRLAEEIPVMIPVENTDVAFPQAYKMYGGSIGLKCSGNGETASERVGTTSEFRDKECPCPNLKTDSNPKGECTVRAHLQVILPEVDMGGVYQLDMGSINSIIDINSGIDYVRSLFGRVAMIPLILRRVPTETHHDGKKQTHWTVQLKPVGDINAIIEMRKSDQLLTHTQMLQIEPPEDIDPTTRPIDMEYEQPEHIGVMLEELSDWKKNGRLRKSEIEAVRQAVEENDDAAIEKIHATVQARKPTGTKPDDIVDKLKKDKPEPEQVKEEPPVQDEPPVQENDQNRF